MSSLSIYKRMFVCQVERQSEHRQEQVNGQHDLDPDLVIPTRASKRHTYLQVPHTVR